MDFLRRLVSDFVQVFRAPQSGPAITESASPPPLIPREIEHHVHASSFADPADIEAFKRCKKRGGSDQDCFKVGDNGVSYFGADTTGPEPICALPPEDLIERWGSVNAAYAKPVMVATATRSVVCLLKEKMPHRAHIENGAGIDLNPAAIAALGQRPPAMFPVVWRWLV